MAVGDVTAKVLFLNMNGSGMGHMNRCLAYARRLRGKADACFFSLASAIEIIEGMGFEADYFVSHFWTRNTSYDWNCELAVRFGLMLERVRPDVVVFDGTWPFQGFTAACKAYGAPAMVWSNRGLLKEGAQAAAVDEAEFDLVIQPGELGASYSREALTGGGARLCVPPVTVLDDAELLDRGEARKALDLEPDGRYALFSLGPGNLKDVSGIGHALIRRFEAADFRVIWARAPISVRDVELPQGVTALSAYPLVRYMRAFDAFVGAAGYNTCCEVVQAQVPGLLVPNDQLVDDQVRRAYLVAEHAPVVVSACETETERAAAVASVLAMAATREIAAPAIAMNGADVAANAILELADRRSGRGWRANGGAEGDLGRH